MFASRFTIAAAACLASTVASATVFQATYTPSQNPTTYVYSYLPVDYRTPQTPFSSANAGGSSGNCANVYCSYTIGNQTSTEFVASGNFSASHIVVPIVSYPIYQRGIGWNVYHYNETTSAWDGLGFAQLDSATVPYGQQVEARLAFGNNSTYSYGTFASMPISFTQGEKYMIATNGAYGGIGTLNWFASDLAAGPSQTENHIYTNVGGYVGSNDLPYQMAWALTDGGSLAVVPEPASWAMMLGGFGLIGWGARRRRTAAFS